MKKESKIMFRKFFKYVTQSMAGMIGISIYILADTFFISLHSGANGLTVLNLILPVYGVLYAIGAMIGIGSATRYCIIKSKGKNADCYFGQSLMWSILFSIPFVLCGILFPANILKILGADASLVKLGTVYLRIVLLGSLFFMSNHTFTAFTRNDDAPSRAMLASIIGSLFNIVFDYIFMFPMNMGLAGAALATALSPVVTMSVCSTHLFGKKSQVAMHLSVPSFRHLLSCCQLGISAFVGEISSAVITTVFNMLLLNLAGNIGVAAYGVVANYSIVAVSVFNGLAQGTQPLFSESYGAGNSKDVHKILRYGILTCLIVEALVVICAWGMTDSLIAIFNSEQNLQLITYAQSGMRLYFLGFLLAGINILLVSYFSAVDDSLPAIVGSVMRGAVAITICAILLSRWFGIDGVWISFLASEILTFVTILILYKFLPYTKK